jgi:hypothetical protein
MCATSINFPWIYGGAFTFVILDQSAQPRLQTDRRRGCLHCATQLQNI